MAKITNTIKLIFKIIEKVFIWSSGADTDILNQVPTEKSKYFGIGGTIVFTSLMASFAGGYAFQTAFKDPILSVFFGMFWGALIFNLDRYIVSTFGVGDGKKTISRQELFEAFPRILMAMLLGFVIATPLELKLFEKEINAEISTQIALTNNIIIKSGENDLVLTRLKNERVELERSISNRNNLIEDKRAFWEKANRDKNDEWNIGKFSGKRGKGGYYNDLKKVADDAEKGYTATKNNYNGLNENDYSAIDDIDVKIINREYSTQFDIENQKTIHAQNDGLIARLRALDNLMYQEVSFYEVVDGEKKLVSVEKEKSVVWYAKWLITFLFIFIEIAPILFKMMTERGPYDDILDRIKHEERVKQLFLTSNINDEINLSVRANSEKNSQKLEAELLANKKMLESISFAQAEIAHEAIKFWKLEQIEKTKNNVNSIIGESN